MALTAQQYQDLIVLEVGDDAAGTLLAVVPLYWERFAAHTDTEARYRATKLAAIDAMLGRVRGQVKITGVGGASIDAGQLTANLQAMRATLLADMSSADAGAAGAAVGELETTSPIMPPTGAPDASSRAYRGDPYLTRRRR